MVQSLKDYELDFVAKRRKLHTKLHVSDSGHNIETLKRFYKILFCKKLYKYIFNLYIICLLYLYVIYADSGHGHNMGALKKLYKILFIYNI